MQETVTVIDAMNLFEGKQAIKELLFAIATQRAKGQRVLKILHSGEKSTIAKVHRELKRLKTEGKLACYHTGKRITLSNPDILYIIDKFPFVAQDPAIGGEDEKCTLVFLG